MKVMNKEWFTDDDSKKTRDFDVFGWTFTIFFTHRGAKFDR